VGWCGWPRAPSFMCVIRSNAAARSAVARIRLRLTTVFSIHKHSLTRRLILAPHLPPFPFAATPQLCPPSVRNLLALALACCLHRTAWQRVHPIFAPSLWHCKHSRAACRLRCVSWRSCWSALLASVGGGGGVLLLAALPSAACDQVVCKRESRCSTAVIHSTSITSIRIRIVSMLVPHGLPYDCHSRLATHVTTVPTMPPHHHAKLASSLLLCFLSLSLSLSFSLAHAMAPSPSPPSVLVHLYLLHRTARQCISGHRLLFVAMHT